MTDPINTVNIAAWLIGLALMLLGAIYLAFEVATWLLERILRNLQIYSLFVQFLGVHFKGKLAKKLTEGRK